MVACALGDLALDALAIAAASRIAVARPGAVGAVFAFFFRLAMGTLVRLDQRLAIGDRDLIIVRVDFAESQKTVAVAAIFDEGPPPGILRPPPPVFCFPPKPPRLFLNPRPIGKAH